MRTITVLALSACLIALAPTHAQPETVMHNQMQSRDMSEDERAVWRVIEAWNDAFARNDAERYFAFIDPDITVMTPASPYRVEGVEDDRTEFEFGIRVGTTRVSFFQELLPHVRVFSDSAVVTYFHRGYYGPEGEGRMLNLKETAVLRRDGEGWRIVHIHVSQ